jgi:DNA-binding GntR family transcriptional regulator
MSRRQEIKDRLVSDIVAGVFPFGARLTIDELATRYEVSHLPVREALRELSATGLLEVNLGGRVRVCHVDQDFIENLFATRGALEVMLVRSAAQLATPASLRPAREHQARLEQCAAAGDSAGVLAANHDFHRAINAITRNVEAIALIDRHWVLMSILWGRVGYGPERFDAVISDHRHLLYALAASDVEAAGVLMGAHVVKAKYELLARIAKQTLAITSVA